jgi:hypothetical protein
MAGSYIGRAIVKIWQRQAQQPSPIPSQPIPLKENNSIMPETILLALVTAVLPELPALVADVGALFKKYPTMTPQQISALVTAASQQADDAFADALSTIASDQAAHPATAVATAAVKAK